ncbi:MAG: 3-phosphoshikimate 1-carboxyvinyltransferase [Acidipropionibacterium jensenii]|uniref:3-phosphoshikimate 1-carboxyvinyltransferase n=1 Tax=Acidipropionibacterium jensenii TaxID=1749 RepID=UPI0026480CEA|nr:3-phosphoshikimate 1-carboxyvinyltransferase [Acidipropionibacterium jensenii]MDN6480521.1 3-phosphoshikimate 1-carboxyvinyltransferase [Acidipropionibacterium jensenii]
MPESGWPAPTAPGPVDAQVVVPGSKSQTNRALLLAGLADGPSTLDGVLRSRDTTLMRAGLTALGVGFQELGPGRLRILPPDRLHHAEKPVDCGLAGTVMRFLPAAAATAPGPTRFIGDPAASARPVAPVLEGLSQLGVRVEGDRLPFPLAPPARRGGPRAPLAASGSSQFVSALLLSGARYPHGIDLRHRGPAVPSAPHIAMTCTMLAERGVEVSTPDPDHWRVRPGPIAAMDATVEPDLTNAAVFLAAAMVTAGRLTIPGWPERTTQPGVDFLDVARSMGARVARSGDRLSVIGGEQLHGAEVDLHEASELTPVVAALAALAHGRTRISGVAHIRGHETDRLAALEEQLSAVGAEVRQTPDGLVVEGRGPAALHGALLRCHDDHRMAHAAALIGLVVSGVVLDDVSCTSKTMPDFPQMWSDMIGPR